MKLRSHAIVVSVAAIALAPRFAHSACTGASPSFSSTPDYASVSACVAQTKAGDTITVAAGSATWQSTLEIKHGLTLVGAGIGTTVLSGTVVPFIRYAPTASDAAHDDPFRVTGFTFDLKGAGQAFYLTSNNSTTLQTKVRIDHNRAFDSSYVGAGVENLGMRGVIDHNTFESMRGVFRAWGDKGDGSFWWATFPDLQFGAVDDDMYIEDNTILDLGDYMLGDSDSGGRVVYRYNSISGSNDMYPLVDYHGGGASRGPIWGSFGGEVYGNDIHLGGFLVSQRGGRVTVHHNTLSGGGSVNIYDNNGCPIDPNAKGQLINHSYHFDNRKTPAGALVGFGSSAGDDCGNAVVRDSTFWMDEPSCEAPSTCASITSGVGCGTLAQRPASCSPGTGYWVTDQACDDLTGMTGPDTKKPISGTLWICATANKWISYYTPLPYPHPLQGGPDGGVDAGSDGGSIDAAPSKDATSPIDAGALTPESDGCGCRVVAAPSSRTGALFVVAAACITIARRRRRSVSRFQPLA